MQLKKLIALSLLYLNIVPNAYGHIPGRLGECEKVLDVQEEAILAQETHIKELEAGLEECQEIARNERIRAVEAIEERDVWYRNPFVYLGLGLIVGGLIAK